MFFNKTFVQKLSEYKSYAKEYDLDWKVKWKQNNHNNHLIQSVAWALKETLLITNDRIPYECSSKWNHLRIKKSCGRLENSSKGKMENEWHTSR